MTCSKCQQIYPIAAIRFEDSSCTPTVVIELCTPCFSSVLLGSATAIGPMPGGGWGFQHGAAAPEVTQEEKLEYDPLPQEEATHVLIETAQGKYHRESFQDRIAALEKDGLFLCRRK